MIRAVSFALIFGCPPSVGVKADTRMVYDISEALIDGKTDESTCTFPDVIETLQASDVNLELVTSSTLRPLKMFYVHNVVRILRGYIFVQEYLEGFGKFEGTELCDDRGRRIGDVLPALDLAQKIKAEMEDPTSTNISDVELLVNLTKDETIQKFHEIR